MTSILPYNILHELINNNEYNYRDNIYDFSILHLACIIGSFDMIIKICSQKPELINDNNNIFAKVPLTIFLEYNMNSNYLYNITNFFINNYANINIQDIKGKTPIYYCIKNLRHNTQYLDIIKLLCLSGADLDIENINNQTPIHYLFYKYYIRKKLDNINFNNTVKLLITNQNINKKDKDGCTPLFLTLSIINYYMFKYIINNYNVDYSITNNDGLTILSYSILTNLRYIFINDIIKKIKNTDIINIKDLFGFTSLNYAIIRNDTRMIKNLIKYGSDVSHIDNNNLNIIQHSILSKNNINVISYIVKKLKKNDMLHLDNQNFNALHYSFYRKNLDIVKIILDKHVLYKNIDNNDINCAIYNLGSGSKNINIIKQLIQYNNDNPMKYLYLSLNTQDNRLTEYILTNSKKKGKYFQDSINLLINFDNLQDLLKIINTCYDINQNEFKKFGPKIKSHMILLKNIIYFELVKIIKSDDISRKILSFHPLGLLI